MSKILNQERFNPSRIPGLSLWTDASDPTTLTITGGSNVTQWNDKSGNSNNLVSTFFNSLSFPGLSIWLDGADPNGNGSIPSNGSPVSTWVDKSGNSRNGTGNGSPTWSSNGVNFNGSSTYFSMANCASLYANTYFSIFVVENLNSNKYALLMGDDTINGNDATLHIGYRSSTDLTFAFYYDDLEITSISGTGNVRIWCFNLPSYGNRNVRLNGNVVGTHTNNIQLGALTRYVIGRAFNSSTRCYSGTIYEILGYKTDLSVPQIQQIEGYLAWKWGLVPNLPTNHPYKNFNPYSLPYTSFNTASQPSIYFPMGTQMKSVANSGLGPFNPTTIPGCQLWLDGSDPNGTGTAPSIGTVITNWKDKSGKNNNFTQYGTSGPSYVSGGGLAFDNTLNTVLASSSQSLTPIISSNGSDTTIFIVSYYYYNAGSAAVPNHQGHFGLANNNGIFDFFTPYYGPSEFIDLGTNQSGHIITNSISINQGFNIYSLGRSGTYTFFNTNGVLTGSTNGGLASFSTITDRITIGGVPSEGSCYKYIIKEFLVFNTPLNTPQIQQIEGYLAWKWGLKGNLPTNHTYKYVNPTSLTPKTIMMVYQCPQTSSTMRFSIGNDVSGGAFGLAHSNGTIYAPYQYAYGDTYWNVNPNTYVIPTMSIATFDATSNFIFGSYDFNGFLDARATALQPTISADTPYVLGTSINTASIFSASNFYVNEIVTYNRAITTTQRQQLEGYFAWKWNMVNFLPIGHPYAKFPPSGEQVIDMSTPSNIFSGLVLWLDMADSTKYTTTGTTVTSITDKLSGTSFTISGKTSALSLSNIGTLPSVNFGGNNTGVVSTTTNPFIYKTLAVPPQGSAISIFVPGPFQLTSIKLGVYSWSNNSPALGFNAPSTAVPTFQTYNPGTNTFYGPSITLPASTPVIIYWAWYGGNAIYLSSNGNTLLSNIQGANLYSTTSTNNVFYIGNDSGFGANFNLGELCVYNTYLETPFRQSMEGYLAWKWGVEYNLPSSHPYYTSAPSLQTLTEVNALSIPTDISGLTLWVDAADSTSITITNGTVSTWTDKSPVGNNFTSVNISPTLSNFGKAPRPSVYFGPGASMKSLYNSGASGNQFSAFLVASVPNLSYLFVSTGQSTTGTTLAPGQTFGFYASNASSVYSPFVSTGTNIATNLTVGNYATISGTTFELFANVSGQFINGNMNFASSLNIWSNVNLGITATPWVIGDCSGDTIPKSFHVHEMITYSRNLTTNERQQIEGYLYWKWLI